ncbi:HAMP domain-containing sensor histidine kinase [Methylomonas sp. AM2-LC]|uniref:two-component system sensor histidine kinase NtrB n=1 Tax=Methylomonas sp. AM2-LC TaxID=3153301 RepID=UPI003266DD2B
MPIRRIILISFVLLSSLIALPLLAVLFFSSRNTIETEISRNLNSDAVMLMQEVDIVLFECMQNVHSWSHLDIMQEARIGDIDKRLSQFLSDMEYRYKGMYQNLFYIDTQNKVIAASRAAQIGHVYQHSAPELKVDVPLGEVFIEDLSFPPPPYQNAKLVIRAPVNDRYSASEIGQLFGLFDMQQLYNLLDQAMHFNIGERYIVLLDGSGRAIAASANLRNAQVLSSMMFADWKPKQNQSLLVHDGNPIVDSPVLVGYANSAGYLSYMQMGWSILVFQRVDDAFLPVRSLLILFVLVIVLTLLLALSASHWLSGYIAKPLLSLTQWVRDVRLIDKRLPPLLKGAVEIQELASTFLEVLHELQQSREQLIQTAKLAVVGEMSAIMAHEIRTPLGIISTSAQWLQRESSLSAEGKEMSQFILDESARLKKLMNTLLDCSRPREPLMLENNVHDIIEHTIELLSIQAENKHIQIEKQWLINSAQLDCDAEMLTQVFLNLLLNAIQILPAGGLIHIRTRSILHFICIDIADTGPGINKDDFQQLFEPFFSKREGGIGLGLTVTRQIVLAHHGKISVSASCLGGACFTIQLPIRQD